MRDYERAKKAYDNAKKQPKPLERLLNDISYHSNILAQNIANLTDRMDELKQIILNKQ